MTTQHGLLDGPWDAEGRTVLYLAPSADDAVTFIEIRANVTQDGWNTVAFIDAAWPGSATLQSFRHRHGQLRNRRHLRPGHRQGAGQGTRRGGIAMFRVASNPRSEPAPGGLVFRYGRLVGPCYATGFLPKLAQIAYAPHLLSAVAALLCQSVATATDFDLVPGPAARSATQLQFDQRHIPPPRRDQLRQPQFHPPIARWTHCVHGMDSGIIPGRRRIGHQRHLIAQRRSSGCRQAARPYI
jgi:hypothetical protein